MPRDFRELTTRCFCPPRRLLTAGALLVALGLGGCASDYQAAQRGLYPQGAPFATAPHLQLKWRQGVDAPQMWDFRPRQYSSPAYRSGSDALFVGTASGSVFKLRGGDGTVVWQAKLDGPIHAEPTVVGGRVYVGSLAGKFYALDELTGDIAWEAAAGGSVEAQAHVAQGRVFFTNSEDVLSALDATTGKSLWAYQRAVPEYFTIMGSGTPVVQDDTVYCGFADGVLVALQADSGELIWQQSLAGEKTEFIDVDTRPIVVGDTIFAASYDGGVYAIDRATGEENWRKPISGVADMVYGERILYVATAAGRIIALGADDGEPEWSFKFASAVPVALVATDLFLFISTANGPLYTLDRMSGNPLMSWNPSTGFNTRLAVGETGGFLFSNGGYLYGIDVAF